MSVDVCPRCGGINLSTVPGPFPGGHHAKLFCVDCDRFIKWLPKPETEASRRPAAHRELVKKYSRGFCEMCLRQEADLPKPQTLEAHHVDEFAEGGDELRENIWILCTSCHRLVNHQRTYLGHYATEAG